MFIGYARVSTTEQTLDFQEDDLQAAGCERIFTDVASGAKAARPGLAEAMDHLRKGDTLVVWRLDRLGRSLGHLIETVGQLQKTGRGFRSLREQIDTTTPGGKLVFHLFGALAEFEREVIRERTKAGLSSARARGRVGGRPRRLDQKQAALATALMADRNSKVADTRESVALQAGYSVSGGGFLNAISQARVGGFLEGTHSLIITAKSIKAVGDVRPIPTGKALVDYWTPQLGRAERFILEVVTAPPRRTFLRDYIALQAGYAATGGGFLNALSRLRTLGIIEGSREIKAAPEFFASGGTPI